MRLTLHSFLVIQVGEGPVLRIPLDSPNDGLKTENLLRNGSNSVVDITKGWAPVSRDLAVVRVGEDLHGPAKLFERKKRKARKRATRKERREKNSETHLSNDSLVRETGHVRMRPLESIRRRHVNDVSSLTLEESKEGTYGVNGEVLTGNSSCLEEDVVVSEYVSSDVEVGRAEEKWSQGRFERQKRPSATHLIF